MDDILWSTFLLESNIIEFFGHIKFEFSKKSVQFHEEFNEIIKKMNWRIVSFCLI